MKQTPSTPKFRGKYLIIAVSVVYCLLFIFNPDAGRIALLKSGLILIRILPVFLVVILCTTLLNLWIKPKQIARHLGTESGYMGWVWALAAGVISHGPMYAWYPMLEELRKRGMRDGLLTAFFTARAIKVPLLPMMVDYFGLLFTLTLCVNILIGAMAQGCIVEFLNRCKNGQ